MATDGFIAASLLSSLQNGDQLVDNVFAHAYGNNSDANYQTKYDRLVKKWNKLVNEHSEIVGYLTWQITSLLTFMNVGRYAVGLPTLSLSEILEHIHDDLGLASIRDQHCDIYDQSPFDYTKQNLSKWRDVNSTFTNYLTQNFSRDDNADTSGEIPHAQSLLDGTYGELSGYQRFRNVRLNNQMLVERNRKLKIENCDLLDEVDRLNEDNAKLRAQLEALQAEK